MARRKKHTRVFLTEAVIDGVCLTCGTPLKVRKTNTMFPYCDNDCLSARPITQARLESEFGHPVREIVVTALNYCKTIKDTAEILEVNREELHKLMHRLGIKKVFV